MKDLKDIKFWLFDLDNTLYDGATKVFDPVSYTHLTLPTKAHV